MTIPIVKNDITLIESRYSSFDPWAQSNPNKKLIESKQDDFEKLPDIRRSNRQKNLFKDLHLQSMKKTKDYKDFVIIQSMFILLITCKYVFKC